jgi:hypothetical protein
MEVPYCLEVFMEVPSHLEVSVVVLFHLEVFTVGSVHLRDSTEILCFWGPLMDMVPAHSKESMYPVHSVDFMVPLPMDQDTAMAAVIRDKF